MGTRLVLSAPRKIDFVEEPDPPLGAAEVRVRTILSGISTGTELASYRGTSPHLAKRWDDRRRMFVPDEQAVKYPVMNLGYEEVGEVVEIGRDVKALAVGQRVFGTWNHRTNAAVAEDVAKDRILPDGADPLVGIYSHIGAITLNGILDAQINLGETVAVFGLGVIGQVVVQLAKLSGARIVGVDLDPMRLELAERLGADVVIDARTGSAAEKIKELTASRGADVCIESSGSTLALGEALRACAYSSRVVAMGFFQGEARGLMLGEEFHHNRIDLVCSQISGVAPGLRHRWDRVRLVSTFMDLAVRGSVDVRSLVTHRRPFRDAASLFALLAERPGEALQTVLTFDEASA